MTVLTDAPGTPEAQLLVTDLHKVLHNAHLFVHKGDEIPSINGVYLESTGTHLVATGTDRFMLGASAVAYADEKWTTLLPLAHVTTLLAVLKASSHRAGPWKSATVKLSPEGYRLKVAVPTDDIKFSFPTARRHDDKIEFPLWKQLLKEPTEPITDTTRKMCVDAQKLAKFSRVKADRHVMEITVRNPNKSMRVRMGSDFIGLIMPIRITSIEDWKEPTWL
jgi:hypothetical protein